MSSNAVRNTLLTLMSVLVGVLLLAVGFLARVATEPEAQVVVQEAATPEPGVEGSTDIDFGVLDEILDILAQDFVEPDRIDRELLFEGAIDGIFTALGDPHSTYIDPTTYAVNRDDFSGAFQGIGATVSRQDNYVVIVRPLPGTPAESAGLEAGDA